MDTVLEATDLDEALRGLQPAWCQPRDPRRLDLRDLRSERGRQVHPAEGPRRPGADAPGQRAGVRFGLRGRGAGPQEPHRLRAAGAGVLPGQGGPVARPLLGALLRAVGRRRVLQASRRVQGEPAEEGEAPVRRAEETALDRDGAVARGRTAHPRRAHGGAGCRAPARAAGSAPRLRRRRQQDGARRLAHHGRPRRDRRGDSGSSTTAAWWRTRTRTICSPAGSGCTSRTARCPRRSKKASSA